MAAPMSRSVKLDSLPFDPLLLILSHLDYRDLTSCRHVCHRLNEVACHDFLWKNLCKKHWLKHCCRENCSWQKEFISMYKEFGRYIHCYPRICRAWQAIENFMKTNLPEIYRSLQDGSTEASLNALEELLGEQLPDDFRCSYRIHDGQVMSDVFHRPGLMGSIILYSFYQTFTLFSTQNIRIMVQKGIEKGRVPVVGCYFTSAIEWMSLSHNFNLTPSQMFVEGKPNHDTTTGKLKRYFFTTGSSFEERLCSYAQDLEENMYPVMEKEVYKFYKVPSSVATTNYITVECRSCFLAHVSSVHPPRLRFAYRITMSMAEDAPPSASCQLDSRHWEIEDGNGEREHVDGPGVVGEYPIMRPGLEFSWISGTHFTTCTGKMWGHFTMHKLHNGEEVQLTCPVFHMRSLPYLCHEMEPPAVSEPPC